MACFTNLFSFFVKRSQVDVKSTSALISNIATSFDSLLDVKSTSALISNIATGFDRYLSLLQGGASYHGVDERYREWLEGLPTVSSRDAQALPERTNTASKALTNAFVTTLAVALIAGVRYFQF